MTDWRRPLIRQLAEAGVADPAGDLRRLFEAERNRADATRAADRKSQVGTGDRSERIRTYNFPQGRVTDHRSGLTLHKIERVMLGEFDEIIDALTAEDEAARLAAEGE